MQKRLGQEIDRAWGALIRQKVNIQEACKNDAGKDALEKYFVFLKRIDTFASYAKNLQELATYVTTFLLS